MPTTIDTKKLNEIITLAKWLISIPSISTTKGESIITNAIYNGICDFNYFKKNTDKLFLISHEDQINSSIIALVKAAKPTADTTLLLCNVDTSSVDNYGSLKSYAYKSDEILKKLMSLNISDELKKILQNEHNLFGLGVVESKGAAATFLMLLKSFSDKTFELTTNLVFVCTTGSLDKNKGIKACLPYLDQIAANFKLKYTLAINAKPCPIHDDKYHIYTKSLGHICPCFYIISKNGKASNPYKNFSSSLLAAKLIEKLELNPQITKDISSYCSSLSLNKFYTKNTRLAMSDILLKFKLDFFNLDPNQLIVELKKCCVETFESIASTLDDREALYCQYTKSNFSLDLIEAEVITYKELITKAKSKYQGNLTNAIETLIFKARQDFLNDEEILCSILDRLIELSHIQRPAIIIFLSDDYCPQQNFFESIPDERESIMHIHAIVDKLNSINDYQIVIEQEAYHSQDISFLRPTAADCAVEALSKQCPINFDPFYNLNVPTITLGVNGYDMHLPSERILDTMLIHMLNFVEHLLKNDIDTSTQTKDSIKENSAIAKASSLAKNFFNFAKNKKDTKDLDVSDNIAKDDNKLKINEQESKQAPKQEIKESKPTIDTTKTKQEDTDIAKTVDAINTAANNSKIENNANDSTHTKDTHTDNVNKTIVQDNIKELKTDLNTNKTPINSTNKVSTNKVSTNTTNYNNSTNISVASNNTNSNINHTNNDLIKNTKISKTDNLDKKNINRSKSSTKTSKKTSLDKKL